MTTLNVLFTLMSAQFNLPPELLTSVCYVESAHKITAIHRHDGQGDSIGICQIKLKTARFMGFNGTEKQLLDPNTNIYYAAKYIRYQLNRYGNTTQALIAYNKGNAKGLTKTKYSDKVIKQWRLAKNERTQQIRKIIGNYYDTFGDTVIDWSEIRRRENRLELIKQYCDPEDRSCADLRQKEIFSPQLAQRIFVQQIDSSNVKTLVCMVRRRKLRPRDKDVAFSSCRSLYYVFT